MKEQGKSEQPTRESNSLRREEQYNPLEKRNLANSIAKALLEKPLDSLPPGQRFLGAGVYAIYYFGNHPLYQALADHNRTPSGLIPIYVGKAVPKGARKGADLEAVSGSVLFDRLAEHGESIEAAVSLSVGDFQCRYLAVDDIFIPLGESLLVATYSPVWNVTIDGFGNHDPGSGRHQQKRSSWDVLHPGHLGLLDLSTQNTILSRCPRRFDYTLKGTRRRDSPLIPP
jgi:hypothetical protein